MLALWLFPKDSRRATFFTHGHYTTPGIRINSACFTFLPFSEVFKEQKAPYGDFSSKFLFSNVNEGPWFLTTPQIVDSSSLFRLPVSELPVWTLTHTFLDLGMHHYVPRGFLPWYRTPLVERSVRDENFLFARLLWASPDTDRRVSSKYVFHVPSLPRFSRSFG